MLYYQYNWKEISFPSQHKDFKMFELNNNKSISLNILSDISFFHSYSTEKNIKIIIMYVKIMIIVM